MKLYYIAKTIKLQKTISRQIKHIIQNTCHLNINKRYSWLELLEDKHIKFLMINDNKNTWEVLDKENLNENNLNNFQVENICENIINKSKIIIEYYNKYLINDTIQLEYLGDSYYYNEVTTFIMLIAFEIELLIEFLNSKSSMGTEIHIVKLSSNSYEYSYSDIFKDKLKFNKENPNIKPYINELEIMENKVYHLLKILLLKIGLDINKSDSYEYLKNEIQNEFQTKLIKYFFSLFDKICKSFESNEIQENYNEAMICKYCYEITIFLRMISGNKQKSSRFDNILNCLENDSEINLLYSKEIPLNVENLVIFTFVGGILKKLDKENYLEKDITAESKIYASNDSFKGILEFFPCLIKTLVELSKKLK